MADYLRALAAGGGSRDVVLAPIGFVCENMETVYDLDVEVGRLCEELGLNLVRSGVVGSHRRFVQMIRELVLERTETKPRDWPWGATVRGPISASAHRRD